MVKLVGKLILSFSMALQILPKLFAVSLLCIITFLLSYLSNYFYTKLNGGTISQTFVAGNNLPC